MFVEIGNKFIALQTEIYGTDHIYNCDTYNEMLPPTADPTYLKAASTAVYQGNPGHVRVLAPAGNVARLCAGVCCLACVAVRMLVLRGLLFLLNGAEPRVVLPVYPPPPFVLRQRHGKGRPRCNVVDAGVVILFWKELLDASSNRGIPWRRR